MKKLLKREWKFYTGITILLTVVLIGWSWMFGDFSWIRLSEFTDCGISTLMFLLPDMLKSMYYIDTDVIMITILAYGLLKLYQYWMEKSSYGRDFLATLPVRKTEKTCFYLLADALFILLPNVAYILIKYASLKKILNYYQVTSPRLSDGVLSNILVIVAYLLMLFAASRFIECLIVNGVLKIFGVVAVGALCLISMFALGTGDGLVLMGSRHNWIDGYVIKLYEEAYEKYNLDKENITPKDLYQGEYGTDIAVYYKDKPIEDAFFNIEQYYDGQNFRSKRDKDTACVVSMEWLDYDLEMQGMSNYGEIPDAELVLCNAVLAVVMLLFIIFLSGRQEASKEILYFRFAKYLFAGLPAVTICCVFLPSELPMWQKIITIFAAAGTFVLCVNRLSPKEERWF